MNIIIYIYIFLVGITFGSFFTLAVYRLPLGKDIVKERSFCPNCNHKLTFPDLIPLFSYIFLKGRCRYCKQKIRPRYFILELLSGIVFVLFAVSINFSVYNLSISKIVYFIIGLLYIAGLFIIAGIDKEKVSVQKEITIYLIVIQTIYIIYLYTLEHVNIYRYVIYMAIIAILTLINSIYYKKKLKPNYKIDILTLLIIMLMFTFEWCTIISIIIVLLAISIENIFYKVKHKESKYNVKSKIPIAFYLCVANIITLLFTNILIFIGE